MQRRRNFGGRVLSYLDEIIAAAFDFFSSGRLESERNLYRGVEREGRGGAVNIPSVFSRPLPPPLTLTPNQTWPVE